MDNQAATLMNGPGLGSPGQTLPYATSQAANSVPGLPIMRGQVPGSETDGFNVITWDPRGEFQSGGILQLDNPFYEGRDVSALIDWRPRTPRSNRRLARWTSGWSVVPTAAASR